MSRAKAVNSNIVGGDRQDGISLNKESSRVAMSNLKHKKLACVALSMGRLYISRCVSTSLFERFGEKQKEKNQLWTILTTIIAAQAILGGGDYF